MTFPADQNFSRFRRKSAAVATPQAVQVSERCVCGARCGLATSSIRLASKLSTEVEEAAVQTLSGNWHPPFCVR